jgi:hypothetical protein
MFQRSLVHLLVVAACVFAAGCGKKITDPPPPATDRLEVVDDMYSSHLATWTQSDGTSVAVYGERGVEGEPVSADLFVVRGPEVDAVGGVSYSFDAEARRGTFAAGDGSMIDYHMTANADSIVVSFRDATTGETGEFTALLEESQPVAPTPVSHLALASAGPAPNSRSLLLHCPDGNPFRGAISARASITVGDGVTEMVRIRRTQDPAVFLYWLPKQLEALATPAGCQRLYTTLEWILADTPQVALGLCARIRERMPEIRSRLAMTAFCAAAGAILEFAQMRDANGITPVCRRALQREINAMDVEILTWDGWVDRSIPIEWFNPQQEDAIEIGEWAGDRADFRGPTAGFGKISFSATVWSWCISRGETEFFLELSPMAWPGGWTSDPALRAFAQADPRGRTPLTVSGLVPCIPYHVEVLRTETGRREIVDQTTVTAPLDDVELIRWDPTGAVLGGYRFNPETNIDVRRSTGRAGASYYATVAQCDQNGRTDLSARGWHVMRFLNGIPPDPNDVEFFCNEGPGFRFKSGGWQTGLGIRDGRETGYRATGVFTFQVTWGETQDDVQLSFQCTDPDNCDMAQDVSLTLAVPRDQARWFFYNR